MADILAHVPRHGLENVRVAVELILESGTPSAEHVKNVLARLRQAPPPAPLDTALAVTEPPIADTGRYDRLHAENDHA